MKTDRVTHIETNLLEKLEKTFSPSMINLINESHLHQGHQGSPHTGHSHYCLEISSPFLKDKSRLEAHRLIHDCLKEELNSGLIHALSLRIIS